MRVLTRPNEVQTLATPLAGTADRPAPRRLPRLAAALTLGVEEELLLLDPATGQVTPAAPELLARLGGARWAKAELMRFQFEAITDVCASLDQLRAQLTAHRQAAADLAEGLDCLLVASGTAPYGSPGAAHLTASPRYLELARRFPAIVVTSGGSCGCHVHVGVGSRDLGVQVLNRLGPWLPSLLALTANSPFAGGRDTGWASWRYRLWARWPTARPAPVCTSAPAYDTVVGELVRRGAALDEPSVYFLARLSPRYPTVEVRIADTCLEVDDTVLLAGLVRALVTTAMDEAAHGGPVRPASAPRIQAATLAAARHGLAGPGLDPWSGAAVAQRTLLDRLLVHVGPALARSGDDQEIAALVARLDQHGTGAARQRGMRARAASAGELATALTRATLAGAAHPVGPRMTVARRAYRETGSSLARPSQRVSCRRLSGSSRNSSPARTRIDSVSSPAANSTVSWLSTSGSTSSGTPSSDPSGGNAPSS
jgi:carboxylate-amine ligase